jgi:hypothetical protein
MTSIPNDDGAVRDFPDKLRNFLLDEMTRLGIKGDIDGGGCDSGDWHDFVMSEARQGIGYLTDEITALREALAAVGKERDVQWETNNRNAGTYRDNLAALTETLGRDGQYLKTEPSEAEERRIEGLEYRGRSVWAWWAKAHAYGCMVHGINTILGVRDGEHANDAARRVVAERDALSASQGVMVGVLREEQVRTAMAEAFSPETMSRPGWTPQRAMYAALVAAGVGGEGWVECATKLPDIGESVIIRKSKGRQLVCEGWRQIRYEADPEFSWQTAHGVALAEHVTHWRPLPKAPGDGGKG